MKTIYPVIMAVPEKCSQVTRDNVLRLGALARKALMLSAQKSGIILGKLDKSAEGAPLPSGGIFWSLTHKDQYVAGVASDCPTGIDIEKIRPCSKGLYRKTADESEWKMGEPVTDLLFFRYWTAKEAVLKFFGTGLKALSQCRISKILDDHRMVLSYNSEELIVEHFYFDGHIASIISHPSIEWIVLDCRCEPKSQASCKGLSGSL